MNEFPLPGVITRGYLRMRNLNLGGRRFMTFYIFLEPDEAMFEEPSMYPSKAAAESESWSDQLEAA